MVIVIEPIFGLCNRLRTLFSYYNLAKERGERIKVIWKPTRDCPGLFLDYFQKPEGVDFIANRNRVKLTYRGGRWHQKYNPKHTFIYQSLKLKPYLFEKIQEKIKLLEDNYMAIHVRRTDHIGLAKKNKVYTNDDDFFKFIDENQDIKYLYLATDNRNTQNKFLEKYQGKIKFIKLITPSNSCRQTDLEASLVDFYMCVFAKKFQGSGWSSFSETINQIRNAKS